MILYFAFVTLISLQMGQSSVVFKNSGVDLYESKIVPHGEKHSDPSRTMDQPKLELIIDYRNLSQAQMFNNQTKKNRRGERLRKRKNGKFGRRNKAQKIMELDNSKNILRNKEKDTLVRNRTIEILKNGVKILSTGENYTQNGNKTTVKVNETLLEKILSSAVSKPDLLISASGIYKLPIGGGVYSSKKLSKSDIAEENYIRSADPNKTEVAQLSRDQELQTDMDEPENKNDKKLNTTLNDSKDYEYEYESFDDLKETWNRNNLNKSFEKPYGSNPDYESINLDYNIEATLENIISVLKNLTGSKKNCSKFFNNCSDESKSMWDRIADNDDPCQRWLECKNDLESAFLGENNHLPSCPCNYPSTIFYDDKIWDENQSRFFRWRDASSETERLDIYKPGAVYCIRSLLAQGSSSISSQQCCYDRELRLLTRGSGAGTVNFVSPDISKKLHDTVDILPWRLCKGDFTRYNLARHPDNGNDCPVNPDNEQYNLQVEYSKYF